MPKAIYTAITNQQTLWPISTAFAAEMQYEVYFLEMSDFKQIGNISSVTNVQS